MPAPQSIAYDPENIFAKILQGDIPCHKIYEDETTLAFMDVMPQTDGHCLVIPKAPSRNLLDIEQADLEAVLATVRKLAPAVMAAFEADGLQIRQYNEEAAGQTVFHTHVHLLPFREGVPLKPHTGEMADHAMLAEHAERIKAEL